MSERIHLFRGAPCVRAWSKYQETIRRWTLCGVHQAGAKTAFQGVEDPSQVSCPYCHQLMASEASRMAKAAK